MKINAAEKPGSQISSYEFIFTPLSISPTANAFHPLTISSNHKYIAELQKGAQLVKRFNTKVEFSKSIDCFFSEGESFRFKIYSQKSGNMTFVVSREDNQAVQFAQSFELEIFKAFQRYTSQLRAKSKEYSRILQKIEQKEQLAAEWKHFKLNCAQHHQNLTATNSNATLQLAYLLDIRSQIDILAENEQPKTKLKPKRSNESERQSNSSINSKSKKNDQNSISTVEKSMNRCHSELMPHEEHKLDVTARTQSIKDFSGTHSQNAFSKEPSVQPLEIPQQQEVTKVEASKDVCFIPIQSIIRKNENLSDIVEASYEGDSVMNSGGDKTDRKWKQMPEIKQEDETVIMKRKTYHFLNEHEDSPVQIRRNNSLKNLKRQAYQKIDYGKQHSLEDQDLEEQELRLSAFHAIKGNQFKPKASTQRGQGGYLLMLIIFCLLLAVTTLWCLSQKRYLRKVSLAKRGTVKRSKGDVKRIGMRIF